MGDVAFTNYKEEIQVHIGILLDKIRVSANRRQVEQGIDVAHSKVLLGENEANLSKAERHVAELKNFSLIIGKKWGKRKDRVIGHVVWAPPITTNTDPTTIPVTCVIELNKAKFKNLLGHVLSLGAGILYLVDFASF